MATFCLVPNEVNKFKQALKDGSIDPFLMADMASLDRRTYLEKFVGKENAQQVNALYESKLLLKNQKAGMITWAKKVGGMSPVARRDMISRIEKIQNVLDPKEQEAFLNDLASTKLGINVTQEEAKTVGTLSKAISDAKTVLTEDPNNQAKQIEYGSRVYDMQEYLNKINPNKGNAIANIANAPRSLVASLDFVSAPFRHGIFAMSDPAWIKNLVSIPKYMASEKAFRTRMGKIYGSPYYDALQKGGLKIFSTSGDLSKREEQFASRILDKFPLTRGSKRAYSGFLNGLRMDMGVSLLKAAELRGDDIGSGSKLVKDFSTTINNLTGAGSLGRFEQATPTINMAFFSPRKMVATFNTLNPVTYLNPKTSPRARIYAIRQLLGSLAIAATVLGLAKMHSKDSVETDPRSTDFGQIKVGNLRIDVTGGNRTFVTLLARLITGQSKSATTGNMTQLNVGAYKPTTRFDVLKNFALGKVAPGAASVLADILTQVNGMDAFGNKVDVPTELKKQLSPMNITNGMDVFNADPTNTALGITLGLGGLPVNASVPASQKTQPTNWDVSTSQQLTQFKAKVSDATFQKANNDFNTAYQAWKEKTLNTPAYQDLTVPAQQRVLTNGKTAIESKILKQYNFTYKAPPVNLQQQRVIKGLKPK